MTTNLLAAAIVTFFLAYCVNLTASHSSRTTRAPSGGEISDAG